MQYNIGDVVKGKVVGISSYGIFVLIDDKYNGLIHISEISENFVRKITDYVKLGETIMVKIIGQDTNKGHLKLSIKDIDYDLGEERSILSARNSGFTILKEHLPIWISEKKKEYELK